METNPEKRRRGRPEVAAELQKKHRGLSCSDSEWAHIKKLAKAAGLNPSAYLLKLVAAASLP